MPSRDIRLLIDARDNASAALLRVAAAARAAEQAVERLNGSSTRGGGGTRRDQGFRGMERAVKALDKALQNHLKIVQQLTQANTQVGRGFRTLNEGVIDSNRAFRDFSRASRDADQSTRRVGRSLLTAGGSARTFGVNLRSIDFGPFRVSVAGAIVGLTLMAGVLVVIGSALSSLAAGALPAAVVGLLGIGLAVGTAALAFSSMTGPMQEVEDAFGRLRDALLEIRPLVQEELAPGLLVFIETAQSGIPTVTRLMTRMAAVMSDLAESAARVVEEGIFSGEFDRIGNAAINVFRQLGRAGVELADIILTLADNYRGFATHVGDATFDILDNANAQVQAAEASGALAESNDRAIETFDRLRNIAGNIGTALKNIFEGAKGPADDLLKAIEDITEELAKWSESPEGQEDIKKFFEDLETVAKGIAAVFRELEPVLTNVIGPIRDIVVALSDLAAQEPAVAKAIAALLVFRSVSGILKVAGGFIAGIATRLGLLGRAGATAAGAAGLGRFAAFLGGPWGIALAAAATALILFEDDINRIVDDILTKLGELGPMGSFLESAFRGMGDALNGIAGDVASFGEDIKTLTEDAHNLGDIFQNIGKDMVSELGLAGDAFARFTEKVTGFFEKIAEFFGGPSGQDFSGVDTGFGASTFTKIGKILGDAFRGALPEAVLGIVDLFNGITAKTTTGIDKVATEFKRIGTVTGTEIKTAFSAAKVDASAGVNDLFNDMQAKTTVGIDKVATAFRGLGTAIEPEVKTAFSRAKAVASAEATGLFDDATAKVITGVDKVATEFGKLAIKAEPKIKETFSRAKTLVSTEITGIAESVTTEMAQIQTAFEAGFTNINSAVTTHMATITASITSSLRNVEVQFIGALVRIESTVQANLVTIEATFVATMVRIQTVVQTNMVTIEATFVATMTRIETAVTTSMAAVRTVFTTEMLAMVTIAVSSADLIVAAFELIGTAAELMGTRMSAVRAQFVTDLLDMAATATNVSDLIVTAFDLIATGAETMASRVGAAVDDAESALLDLSSTATTVASECVAAFGRIGDGAEAMAGRVRSAASSAASALRSIASAAREAASAIESIPSAPSGAALGLGHFGGIADEGVFRLQGGGRPVMPFRGRHNGDVVPALLEPGEFVVNRRAAQRIGVSTLRRINAQRSDLNDRLQFTSAIGMHNGGLVGANSSGGTGSSSIIVNQTINTQEIDPTRQAAKLAWEIANRLV